MGYEVTQLDVKKMVRELRYKLTAQNIYVTKLKGLEAKRIGRRPPKGGVLLETFDSKSTEGEMIFHLEKLAAKGTIRYEGFKV